LFPSLDKREREREENERLRRLFRAKLSDKKKNCAEGDNKPVRILLEDCKINEQIISWRCRYVALLTIPRIMRGRAQLLET